MFFFVVRVQFHIVFVLFRSCSLASNLLYLRLLQITNCSNKYIHKLIQANSIWFDFYFYFSVANVRIIYAPRDTRHKFIWIDACRVMWNWLRFFGLFERFVVSMDEMCWQNCFNGSIGRWCSRCNGFISRVKHHFQFGNVFKNVIFLVSHFYANYTYESNAYFYNMPK